MCSRITLRARGKKNGVFTSWLVAAVCVINGRAAIWAGKLMPFKFTCTPEWLLVPGSSAQSGDALVA